MAAAAVALPGCAAAVPAVSPPFAHSATLAPGQDARFRIAVAAGDSVALSLQQLDATLRMRASSTTGQSTPVLENDAGRHAQTRLTLSADKAAIWTIDVASARPAQSAHFRLIAGPAHPTRAADRARAKAETALARAENLRREAGSLEHGKHADESAPATVLAAYQSALDAAREAGDACLQLRANSDRARYQFAMGKYAQARDSEVAALKFRCGPAIDLAAAAEEAAAQRTLAAALGYLGDFTSAIAAQQRALALYRQTGDLNFQAMVLGNASADYRETGATHRAMASARASLALAEQIGDRQRELYVRESIAAILMQRGEWGKARRAYLDVLDALRTSPYPLVEGMATTDLGVVDWELRDTRAAERELAQAAAVAAKAGDAQGLADTRLDEADIDLEDHAVDHADAIYRANLGVDIKLGLQREQVHALIGLGEVATARHVWSAAWTSLTQALALARKVHTAALETMAYQALGDLDAARHHLPQAAAQYAHAYALAVRDRDDNSRVVMLGNQARVALAAGDARTADKFIAPAIGLIESERAQIDPPLLRTSYFASLRAYYGLYIDVLMRLHEQDPGHGYATAALDVSEQARARALRDRLLARGIDVPAHVPPALLAAERDAEDDLSQAAWRQEQLPVDASAAARQDAQHEVDAAGRRLDVARGRIYAADPQYAALTYARPFDVTRFRQQLGPRDVVLEYWLGAAHSYRWRITRAAVTARVLPAGPILDRTAAALRASILVPSAQATDASFATRAQAIAAADRNVRQEASALGKLLLPAAHGEHARTRIIVADGALQWIPFDLLDPDGDDDYVYLPSLTSLAELRTRQPAPRKPSLAVFANPVFSPDAPSLARQSAAIHTAPQLADAALREASADAGITALSPLAYSGSEAAAIAHLVPASDRLVATGFAASRANALATDWRRYTLVDFATHSLIDPSHPRTFRRSAVAV